MSKTKRLDLQSGWPLSASGMTEAKFKSRKLGAPKRRAHRVAGALDLAYGIHFVGTIGVGIKTVERFHSEAPAELLRVPS